MLQLEVKYRNTEATCDISRHLGEDKRFLFAAMPCGKEVRNGQYITTRDRVRGNWVRLLEHKDIDDVARDHVYKCVSCQMKLVGYVKRNVMTQQDVADLFMLGVDGKRTPIDKDKPSGEYNYHYRDYYGTGQSNVFSEEGILWHYDTIEAIRLADGTIVDNAQCWSKGRAHCPRTPTRYTLPLTTLSKEFNSNLIDNLILAKATNSYNAVFRLRDNHGRIRQFYYDWQDNFLNELPEECETITEGLHIFTPAEVHAAQGIRNILQQGEFWFIPLKGLADDDVVSIRHAGRHCAYDDGQYLDKNQSHRATRTGTINYHELEKWFNVSGQAKLTVRLAKGHVVHTTRRWRKKLKLGDGKTWHAVFENRAITRVNLA